VKYWRQPLDLEKVKIPHGEVHIIEDRCKGCGFCVEYCPKDVLVLSSRFNRKGYHPPEVIDGKSGECVNCNLCEMICPDFAIFSLALEDEQAAPAA
jgi:2-oxoglutarate ferredoxin oxidoreductase subunit delta